VPQKFKEDPSLGAWVNTQRKLFKNGKMDQERETRLGEISFDFAPGNKGKKHVSHCQTNPVETESAEVDVLRRASRVLTFTSKYRTTLCTMAGFSVIVIVQHVYSNHVRYESS
jgi:hypothetical protein